MRTGKKHLRRKSKVFIGVVTTLRCYLLTCKHVAEPGSERAAAPSPPCRPTRGSAFEGGWGMAGCTGPLWLSATSVTNQWRDLPVSTNQRRRLRATFFLRQQQQQRWMRRTRETENGFTCKHDSHVSRLQVWLRHASTSKSPFFPVSRIVVGCRHLVYIF